VEAKHYFHRGFTTHENISTHISHFVVVVGHNAIGTISSCKPLGANRLVSQQD
jgi:hypothetical protein